MDKEIVLTEGASDTTSISLTKGQAACLTALLERNIPCKLATYLRMVGMSPQNFYAITAGRRKLTAQTLQRLISGTNLEAECRLEFRVRMTGPPVKDAYCLNQEEELFCVGGAELDVEALTAKENQCGSMENQTSHQNPNPD